MVQVQVDIREKDKSCKVGANILARKDATEEEAKVAKALFKIVEDMLEMDQGIEKVQEWLREESNDQT